MLPLIAGGIVGAAVGIGVWVFVVEPLGVLSVLERLTPGIVYRVRMKEAAQAQQRAKNRSKDRPVQKDEEGRTKVPPLHKPLHHDQRENQKTNRNLVGLTFDDGPHGVFTPQVLDILKSHGAKATFFLIGERARRHPELVERIRAEGHEIGNHYIRDGTTLFHSDEEFVRNLLETERVIGIAEGQNQTQDPGSRNEPGAPGHTEKENHGGRTEVPPLQRSETERRRKLFRAPGGVAWPGQLRLARENGYTCVLGCAYPHDPMRPPVWYTRWLIEKNLRPGTIVILHDGIADASKSEEVLPDILLAGRKKGLRFVSVGELMERSKARKILNIKDTESR